MWRDCGHSVLPPPGRVVAHDSGTSCATQSVFLLFLVCDELIQVHVLGERRYCGRMWLKDRKEFHGCKFMNASWGPEVGEGESSPCWVVLGEELIFRSISVWHSARAMLGYVPLVPCSRR